MNSQTQASFKAEQNFFIIDSEKLTEVSTQWYGFAVVGNKLVQSISDLEGSLPAGEGAYIYIKRTDDNIYIYQDFIGCYGVYLYRYNNYFAISNSFLRLVDYVKKTHPITLNKDYCNSFLCSGFCSISYSETMIKEIELLDRSAVVNIDITENRLTCAYIDYQENTISINSEEGLQTLDNWYNKWTGLIGNIKEQGLNIQADLSGGFDSRLTFSLLLGSGIDLNDVFVNSIEDTLHTHAEDYEIASSISKYYNFPLNNKDVITSKPFYFSLDEIINISFYTKLCFHKQMYWRYNRMYPSRVCFGGAGGECIRSYWNKSKEQYVQECLNRCNNFPITMLPQLQTSVKNILERSFAGMQGKFDKFGRSIKPQDLTLNFYRETRCRMHFGKEIVENYLGGYIKYTPLMDPELHKLKLDDDECPDKNLLMAVIFSRYNKDLLSFKFEGQRKIDESTIVYAQIINQKFPYVASFSSHCKPAGEPENEVRLAVKPSIPHNINPPVSKNEVDEYIKKMFYSHNTRHAFEYMYDGEVYRRIVHEINNKQYQPLESAYTTLGVSKIIQDVMLNQIMNCTSVVEQLSEEPFQTMRCDDDGLDLLKDPYLTNYITARIDIKNACSDSNQIELLDVSDKRAKISTPNWFRANGIGVVIESQCGSLDVTFRCIQDGTLNLNLRGRDVRDINGKRIPFYIDYHFLSVNGECVFDTVHAVSHDSPFRLNRKIKDGDIIQLSLKWTHHDAKNEVTPKS